MTDAPPRKLSTDRSSIHYDICYLRVGVKFNGEERKGDVHAYDVDAGWIEVRAKNAMGKFRIDGHGNFVITRLLGTVEPFWKEQRTSFSAPVRAQHDDAAQLSAAESKRQRKAAQRAAIAQRNGSS